jgi:hypothetical protein
VGSVSRVVMLPTAAADLLAADIASAEDLAAAGKVEAGRQVLVDGLKRAEDPRYADEPWTPELLCRYRAALARYADAHDAR